MPDKDGRKKRATERVDAGFREGLTSTSSTYCRTLVSMFCIFLHVVLTRCRSETRLVLRFGFVLPPWITCTAHAREQKRGQ